MHPDYPLGDHHVHACLHIYTLCVSIPTDHPNHDIPRWHVVGRYPRGEISPSDQTLTEWVSWITDRHKVWYCMQGLYPVSGRDRDIPMQCNHTLQELVTSWPSPPDLIRSRSHRFHGSEIMTWWISRSWPPGQISRYPWIDRTWVESHNGWKTTQSVWTMHGMHSNTPCDPHM